MYYEPVLETCVDREIENEGEGKHEGQNVYPLSRMSPLRCGVGRRCLFGITEMSPL
jgi:hypothetical protein